MRIYKFISIVLCCSILSGLFTNVTPSLAQKTAQPLATSITVSPDLTPNYGNECNTNWKRLTSNLGSYFYVTLNTNNTSQSTNSAIWRPDLPYAGQWKVEAYNPKYSMFRWPCPYPNNAYVGPGSSNPPTSDARYKIYHASGNVTVAKSQNPPNDQWINLGTYTFNSRFAQF